MYGMPLNQSSLLTKMASTVIGMKLNDQSFANGITKELAHTHGSASFWHGELDIQCIHQNTPNDTFLKLDGWTKGVAFVNEFNLGRYWPVMGPQVMIKVILNY